MLGILRPETQDPRFRRSVPDPSIFNVSFQRNEEMTELNDQRDVLDVNSLILQE